MDRKRPDPGLASAPTARRGAVAHIRQAWSAQTLQQGPCFELEHASETQTQSSQGSLALRACQGYSCKGDSHSEHASETRKHRACKKDSNLEDAKETHTQSIVLWHPSPVQIKAVMHSAIDAVLQAAIQAMHPAVNAVAHPVVKTVHAPSSCKAAPFACAQKLALLHGQRRGTSQASTCCPG